jgi:hypothetical protein
MNAQRSSESLLSTWDRADRKQQGEVYAISRIILCNSCESLNVWHQQKALIVQNGPSCSFHPCEKPNVTINRKALAKTQRHFIACVVQHMEGHISNMCMISVLQIIHKFKILANWRSKHPEIFCKADISGLVILCIKFTWYVRCSHKLIVLVLVVVASIKSNNSNNNNLKNQMQWYLFRMFVSLLSKIYVTTDHECNINIRNVDIFQHHSLTCINWYSIPRFKESYEGSSSGVHIVLHNLNNCVTQNNFQ